MFVLWANRTTHGCAIEKGDKNWNFTKIGLFSCRCRDLIFPATKNGKFCYFKKVTFLHFSRLLRPLRPLNFFIGRPSRSVLSKNRKIIPVGGNSTFGHGIDCQDCYKNSRLLAVFFEQLAAWIGFSGSLSLLPKNERRYGSVGIRMPEIIAATLRHLASLWKITKNLRP